MKLLFSTIIATATLLLVGCGEVGSEEGAGGSGPGFDGSGHGTGKEGTVPVQGSGVGSGLTNSASTNTAPPTNPTPPNR